MAPAVLVIWSRVPAEAELAQDGVDVQEQAGDVAGASGVQGDAGDPVAAAGLADQHRSHLHDEFSRRLQLVMPLARVRGWDDRVGGIDPEFRQCRRAVPSQATAGGVGVS
jgi:hypothetical protein